MKKKIPYWPHNGRDRIEFVCIEDVYGLGFIPYSHIAEHPKLYGEAKILYSIEARSWVEAMQKHHRRQGWEPYRPMNEPYNA